MARGQGTVWKVGRIWWVQYYTHGQRFRESSGSERKSDAVALLRRRLEERGARPWIRDAERVTLVDLRRLLDQDYALHARRSGVRLDQAWRHIVGEFGETEPALRINPRRLAMYVEARTAQEAAPATIRYELAALRRSFTLALKGGLLGQGDVPAAWPTISVDNRRTGFLSDEDIASIVARLPDDVADVVRFLATTGWRKGEALGLRWADVDTGAGVIRIETSKSGEPRTFPYAVLPELADLIANRREVTDTVQRAQARVVPLVFTRNGRPIGSFGKAWATACRAIGKPGALVHDLRRSAARRLSRAGVPEQTIMALCGWQTRSVFDRYRLVREDDLRDGLAKLVHAVAR